MLFSKPRIKSNTKVSSQGMPRPTALSNPFFSMILPLCHRKRKWKQRRMTTKKSTNKKIVPVYNIVTVQSSSVHELGNYITHRCFKHPDSYPTQIQFKWEFSWFSENWKANKNTINHQAVGRCGSWWAVGGKITDLQISTLNKNRISNIYIYHYNFFYEMKRKEKKNPDPTITEMDDELE